MRARRHATFETLSISALDLFASSLGAFMLLAVMLFPFWLKQPGLQAETAAAEAQLAEIERSRADAVAEITTATEEQQVADQLLARARERLAAAEASAAEAQQKAAAVSAQAAQRAAEAEAAARTAAATPKPVAAKRRPGIAIDDLDLVVVMDTTGSMRHELADVQANLLGIIEVLKRLSPSLRVGFVAYKDRADAYVTRVFPLAPAGGRGGEPVLAFVRALAVGGGGDDPEAIDEALAAAIAQDWRRDAQGRILVVGDARAHPHAVARALDLAREFRASGSAAAPRLVAAVLTGGSPADRTFFQQLAQAGGGDFSEYQGAMIESVLLSVLETANRGT